VDRLPRKKQAESKIRKLAIFILLIILILSSVLVVFNYFIPEYQLPQPSASSFTPEEWMQFIPANIEGFRFINMSALSPIEDLFQSDILLNLTTLGMNITIYDVQYGLDMQNVNDSIINIMAVNQTLAQAVSSGLANSSEVRFDYHNTTIYAIPPEGNATEGYWICVNRGAIIMCEGGDLAFAALKSVVDANSATFFNNDTLKIAYMMASKEKKNFIFTYYIAGGTNTYNVDWLMGGASNSSALDIRILYHFQTSNDLQNNYGNFTKAILSEANSVYKSIPFVIGDFTYPYSQVREVLMSL
jgi:hypothetical protein